MQNPIRIGRLAMCCLLLAFSLRAATVMVRDVDVRGKAVGSQVDIPVHISGVTISSFGAFVLDFSYDTSGLRWDSVNRGALLSVQSPNASPEYAPYLWALEADHDATAGTLRVTGMILGSDPADNTVAGMTAARLANPDGVLLTLRFILLAQETVAVSLVTGTVAGRCALVGDDADGAAVEEPARTALIPGGTLVDGTPNWWALEHFGDPERDPNLDDDGDWRPNVTEYEEDTDPVVVDQRLSFHTGWNMLGFRAVPTLSPAEWVAQVNAAAAVRGQRADDLLSVTVYYFNSNTLRYETPDAFEAGKAYWFYAHASGNAQFGGVPVPSDYSVGEARGWQMVAVPEDLTTAEIAPGVEGCQGWNAATQTHGPRTESVQGAAGYWVYRRPVRAK